MWDIDYVRIKAEEYPMYRRSYNYNYRIVMIKGGQELNMGNYASTGQQALASIIIIIRLALTIFLQCGYFRFGIGRTYDQSERSDH